LFPAAPTVDPGVAPRGRGGGPAGSGPGAAGAVSCNAGLPALPTRSGPGGNSS